MYSRSQVSSGTGQSVAPMEVLAKYDLHYAALIVNACDGTV